MTDIRLTATQSSPAVIATVTPGSHNGSLEMRGDSYPENSFEFFTPVFKWVESLLAEPDATLKIELHLLYLNTSSVKAMMDIFDLLEEAHEEGKKVSIAWYYDNDNERIAELAEEFKEDCSFPFAINTLS
ncbi:DUF1987 domain-containing protein [bacterium]|nr:MAG: DUF1987 domain-containing protein [bacterium]